MLNRVMLIGHLGKDPELKAFATKTLPTLKEHLEMAKKLPGGSGSSAMTGDGH